jgi:hypothetical protein
MKTILFFPSSFNLSETALAIEIAKAISNDFNCHFSTYGGEFDTLIEKEGFPLTTLEPRYTPPVIKHIYALDQGRKVGQLYSVEVVRQMVQGELALHKSLKPAAVVTGMNASSCISCPVSRVPLIWYIEAGKLLNTTARLGRLKNMDMLDVPLIRWLPDRFRVMLSERLINLSYALIARSFNQVAVEYGLEPYHGFEDVLWRSEHQIVLEPPGFSDLSYPPSAHIVGPLTAHLAVPLPDEVLNLPRDLPIIYFAMGSSGRAEIVSRIIAGFAGKPYRVIAPVKHLLTETSFPIPDNVLVTGWLPALAANRLADIAVIHGGIGTVMNACLAGKPAVCVAMSPEQFINLENLAAKGFAIRISRGSLSADRLCSAIDRLLGDPVAQAKARDYRKVIEEWDCPQHIREFFYQKLGGSP